MGVRPAAYKNQLGPIHLALRSVSPSRRRRCPLGLPRRRRRRRVPHPAPSLGRCADTLTTLVDLTIPGFLPSGRRGRANDAVGEWS